jgi:hypothetical protein
MYCFADALGLEIDDEQREAVGLALHFGVRNGARHHQRVVGAVGVGDEGLLAVQEKRLPLRFATDVMRIELVPASGSVMAKQNRVLPSRRRAGSAASAARCRTWRSGRGSWWRRPPD